MNNWQRLALIAAVLGAIAALVVGAVAAAVHYAGELAP